MPRFRLAVQIDVDIAVDPDSGQDITPQGIRRLVLRHIAAMMKYQFSEDEKIPGVKYRYFTRFFSPSAKGGAEVIEVTPEMEEDRRLRPRWKLVRATPDDDMADQPPWPPRPQNAE